jgi:bacterioferritin
MAKQMTKKDKVIAALNEARGMELLAISQYMNQHYGLDDSDFGELAAQVKLIAIDEMQHAERFAERVKELGGEPTAELAGKVKRGQKVQEVFAFDVGEEEGAIEAYNGFLKVCMDNGDSISARLLEEIINEEQEHLNYFDGVRDHIENLGAAYLAHKAGTSSATGLNTMGFVARKGQ